METRQNLEVEGKQEPMQSPGDDDDLAVEERENRNPYDGTDHLDSYHIVPVILSEIATLKELMDDEQSNQEDDSADSSPLKTSTNSGAVLLLRCSDESFDTVMKSLDQQDIQLAISLIEQQISLEEQTEGSLTHLTQLYRQNNIDKFLSTAQALMRSQQRLAWIRSRIIRCMSKHVSMVSSGHVEPDLEPLLNRVLRFPDLSYQFVSPDDEAAQAPAKPYTVASTDSPDDLEPQSRDAEQDAPQEYIATLITSTIPEQEEPVDTDSQAAGSENEMPPDMPAPPSPVPEAESDTSTPQPGDMNLTEPLVGLLMNRLDNEGVSAMTDSRAAATKRRVSGSPPPVPVNSRSTPGDGSDDYDGGRGCHDNAGAFGCPGNRQMSLESDIFRDTPSPLGDVKPLSPFVSSLLGKPMPSTAESTADRAGGSREQSPLQSSTQDRRDMKATTVQSAAKPASPERKDSIVREEQVVRRELPVMTSPSSGSLLPPAPPRRTSSYEVLKRFEQTRSLSRSSVSPPPRSASTSLVSPTKNLPSMGRYQHQDQEQAPEGFGGALFVGSLLRPSPSSAEDEDLMVSPEHVASMPAGVDDATATSIADDVAVSASAGRDDSPQFMGNLSSLMSSRIVFD
ncbi:NHS-like protein 3 isoform X1 [Sycon ciliatum]|uniref:NHS-like protein 3 isoform X1 n=1 Tax=Sycon ciliatum TaxID=27933 RepID=UPI0031F67780